MSGRFGTGRRASTIRRVRPTRRGKSEWQSVSRSCSWHHPSAGLAATAIRCMPRGVGASATGRSSLQPPSMMSSNAATVSILSDRTRKKAGHPTQTPRTEQSGVLTICSRRSAIRRFRCSTFTERGRRDRYCVPRTIATEMLFSHQIHARLVSNATVICNYRTLVQKMRACWRTTPSRRSPCVALV